MQFKRFKSINGEEQYISLTSGHTFRIGSEWQPIPEHAWKDCFAAGCMSEDMITGNANSKEEASVVNTLNNVAYQKDKIRTVIQGWIDNNELNKFDKNNKPLATALTKDVGFRVTTHLRDEVWFKMSQTDDGED